MVVDLGEEGIAGGDGLEVPWIGIRGIVFGQAVRAPVAAFEYGVGSHLEFVAELASPAQRREEISFCHAVRKAFSATEAGCGFHVIYTQF